VILRLRLGQVVIGLAVTTLGVPRCAAEEPGLSARHHAWARFQPGAWKLVRVVTESLDDNGHVIGRDVAETETSLLRVDSDGVQLEVEVGVETAGRQFERQPQCLKQGFHGELAGGEVKFQPATSTEITIEDQKIPCRTQQVEVVGPSARTSVVTFFSDSLSPYILRRQSKTTDTGGTNVLSETLSEVVAFNMPQRVLSKMQSAACIKTVQKTPKGTVTTVAMSSPDVPGGVVYQTTTETDKAGHLIRRSTLELLNYGIRPETERTGLFGRKRPARRKTTVLDGNWPK